MSNFNAAISEREESTFSWIIHIRKCQQVVSSERNMSQPHSSAGFEEGFLVEYPVQKPSSSLPSSTRRHSAALTDLQTGQTVGGHSGWRTVCSGAAVGLRKTQPEAGRGEVACGTVSHHARTAAPMELQQSWCLATAPPTRILMLSFLQPCSFTLWNRWCGAWGWGGQHGSGSGHGATGWVQPEFWSCDQGATSDTSSAWPPDKAIQASSGEDLKEKHWKGGKALLH